MRSDVFRHFGFLFILSLLAVSFCYAAVAGKVVRVAGYPKVQQNQELSQLQKVCRDSFKENLLSKTIRDMSIDELLTAKKYALGRYNDHELAAKYNEQLVILSKDQELLCQAKLELADFYFDNEKYEKASEAYKAHGQFYPGSDRNDYAKYKHILSLFYKRPRPPQDQSCTKEVIKSADAYLKNEMVMRKDYIKQVEELRAVCYQDLWVYESDIIHQYINLNSLQGARTRIANTKIELLPAMPSIEPDLIELEVLVAQQEGNNALADQTSKTLAEKFPDYKPKMLLASSEQPKKYFFGLF